MTGLFRRSEEEQQAKREEKAEKLLKQGMLALKKGEGRMAVVHLEGAKKLHPRNPRILNTLGAAYAGVNRMKDAIDSLEACWNLDPTNGAICFNLAQMAGMQEGPTSALCWYEKGVRNGDEGCLMKFGPIAEKLQKLEKAREVLEEPAIGTRFEGNPKFFFMLGHITFMLSDYDSSLQWYDKALEIEETNPQLIHRKGVVLHHMGKHKEAEFQFMLAERIDPENPLYAQAMVRLQWDTGDREIAKNLAKQRLTRFPNDTYFQHIAEADIEKELKFVKNVEIVL